MICPMWLIPISAISAAATLALRLSVPAHHTLLCTEQLLSPRPSGTLHLVLYSRGPQPPVSTAVRESAVNNAVQCRAQLQHDKRADCRPPSPAGRHKPKLQAAPRLVKRLLRQHLQSIEGRQRRLRRQAVQCKLSCCSNVSWPPLLHIMNTYMRCMPNAGQPHLAQVEFKLADAGGPHDAGALQANRRGRFG